MRVQAEGACGGGAKERGHVRPDAQISRLPSLEGPASKAQIIECSEAQH